MHPDTEALLHTIALQIESTRAQRRPHLINCVDQLSGHLIVPQGMRTKRNNSSPDKKFDNYKRT
jgi:hypothetical protein